MKKFFNAILSVILIFGIFSTANAKNFEKKIIDNELAKMIGNEDTQVTGLGVIALEDGKVVYENFLGKRNLEKNLPVTKDTRFRVASVSKMFTMFGIMKLVEQGKIDLDEDASKYLGFELRNPNFPDEKITVRMLASHTSTIRDAEGYTLPKNYSLEEFFKKNGVAYEDGKHFATEKDFFKYCNLNYGILATIIEKVSGERFDKFIKTNILQPMKINADYVVGNLSEKDFKKLGTLYNKKDGQWIATRDNFSSQPKKDYADVLSNYVDSEELQDLSDYKIGTNATIFNPAGGLRISFAELGNCLEMLVNGGNFHGKQIVREDLLKEMCKKQWIFDEKNKNGDTYEVMFSYGLGLYQIDGASAARLCKEFDIDLIGHSGEASGMISGVYFMPGTKKGVIFMINGVGVEPGVDEKSFGKFSSGFIWEEEIMNPILENILR